ncbi:competence pheromone ComX [Solibacillus sp. CAU 1738]|uniref:competence pheromone ComX n=1 Tax=Solibacillus sp. CAU 1738 TaxID=3140363 RepID=UPI0032604143
MLKIFQFLQENINILELLSEEKVCIIGVTEEETKAILEAFAEEISIEKSNYWQ